MAGVQNDIRQLPTLNLRKLMFRDKVNDTLLNYRQSFPNCYIKDF